MEEEGGESVRGRRMRYRGRRGGMERQSKSCSVRQQDAGLRQQGDGCDGERGGGAGGQADGREGGEAGPGGRRHTHPPHPAPPLGSLQTSFQAPGRLVPWGLRGQRGSWMPGSLGGCGMGRGEGTPPVKGI